MAFIFVCGTHTFTNALKGYETVTVQCQNCGNFSAKCYTRWEWFTFCFVPIIPFSLRPYREVGCRICNFYQDMKYRPDVENGPANQYPMHNMGPGGGGGGVQPPPQNPGGGGARPPPQQYGAPPGGPNTGPVYK